MSKIEIPVFATKEETFDWIAKNEKKIVAQKMNAIKHADAFSFSSYHVHDDGSIVNASKSFVSNKDELLKSKSIRVKCIINTTNLLDSHGDVHIPKLWNKSIKENKYNSLCKEHQFTFDGTITDNVKVYTQEFSWKELGYNFEGVTQALVYEGIIESIDKTGMFERYLKGQVNFHSVGMRYVKFVTCMNTDNPDYEIYRSNYDKYIEMVANRKAAEDEGYFWAVIEAKNIEGSAVKRGSNFITPTLSVEVIEDTNSKSEGTQSEPLLNTQNEPQKSFIETIKQTKFITI